MVERQCTVFADSPKVIDPLLTQPGIVILGFFLWVNFMKTNTKPADYRLDATTRLAGGFGMAAAKQSPEHLLRRVILGVFKQTTPKSHRLKSRGTV